MKQTAVELLKEKLTSVFINDEGFNNLFIQAKEMEKQQIEDAHIEGQRVFDKHPHTQWTNDQAEQYYTSTYGSNGSEHIEHNLEEIISKAHTKITRTKGKEYAPTSNEIQKEIDDTSSQTEHDSPKVQNKDSFGEISDEEMDKAAINFCIKNIDEEVMHWHDIFVSGAKWYREQLKSKQ